MVVCILNTEWDRCSRFYAGLGLHNETTTANAQTTAPIFDQIHPQEKLSL